MIGLSDKERDAILKKIYIGLYWAHNLPKSLYKATAKALIKGVKQGAKGAKSELVAELKENIYVFSAAKTYTQVKDISSLLTEANELLPYSTFKKKAVAMFKIYNEDYLSAEYETAVGQAQTAVKWHQIQQDTELFPYLQRKAVMDANTSEDCKILNDIIAPVGSPFWRTRSPLTHFRCRCILVQLDKYQDVKLSSRAQIKGAISATENINPIFKGNPGIDKVVFNDKHPYFDVEPRDRKFAKQNFNLPIPSIKK